MWWKVKIWIEFFWKIRFWPKSFTTRNTLNYCFCNVSVFEILFLKRVRFSYESFAFCQFFERKLLQRNIFRIKFCTTCQISSYLLYKMSDFGTKCLQHIRCWIKSLKRVNFLIQISTSCNILNQKCFVLTRFELVFFAKKQNSKNNFFWKSEFVLVFYKIKKFRKNLRLKHFLRTQYTP